MTGMTVRRAFVACSLAIVVLTSVAAQRAPEFDIRSGDGKVLIAGAQIRSYDWTTHTLTLAPKVRDELVQRLRQEGHLVSGIPFAVAVREKAIYTGSFTSAASSKSFSTPMIVVDVQIVDPKLGVDQLRIDHGYPSREFSKGADPRGDPRVREALKADGKLVGGS